MYLSLNWLKDFVQLPKKMTPEERATFKKRMNDARKAREEAERLAGARFLAGATGVQPWLDEQNRLWDAELGVLAQQQSQLKTMAGIYRALGGSDRS